jgi:acyl-CoA reductase-like NAD-dependent aldehyde dehydrogenase
VEREGILYSSASWSGAALAAVAQSLRAGAPALRALPAERLVAAWEGTLAAFLDPASPERCALDPALARFTHLSAAGLNAALEAVLGGARRGARELIEAAVPTDDDRPVLVVLAGNLPALAVQPLLPALARRRPVLIKSASAEPLFAPALIRALVEREPRLDRGLAAVTWKGGDVHLEGPLLAAVGRILAYGDANSVDSFERRAPGRVFSFGPKTSLAVVAGDTAPDSIAAGLARDIALFDQRGCLSIQAIYTTGDAAALAEAVAAELRELADLWPPGPTDPTTAAAVHQLRAEAEMRGLRRPEIPLVAGTVVVEPLPAFRPSPGLRTVRIHPLSDLDQLPGILAPWGGALQGAALAGAEAEALAPALTELGVSRCAAPGELQSPDVFWHNGGVHPLEVL